MSDAAFGLDVIGQVLVPVADAERSAAFYRDVLGMRFLYAYPGMAFFDAGGVRLYLAEPESPDFGGRATIYFRVPDLAAAVETLEARGVQFTIRPHVVHREAASELRMAFTRDPDGNNIGLMAEVETG